MRNLYRQSYGLTALRIVDVPFGCPYAALPWVLVGLLWLVGCAPVPIQTDAYHIQEAVLVITTDQALLNRACYNAKQYADGAIEGCYVPTSHPPAIYCPPDNAEVCWHEVYLHHVLKLEH